MDILDRIVLLLNGQEQQELTNYLNLSSTAFTDWKAGRSKSYKKYLIEIAEFFNVSIDYLVYGEEKNPPADEALSIKDAKEQELINIYRAVPETSQREIIAFSKGVLSEVKNKQKM